MHISVHGVLSRQSTKILWPSATPQLYQIQTTGFAFVSFGAV